MLKQQSTQKIFDSSVTGDFKIAIIKTDYHDELVSMLTKRAMQTLVTNGVPGKSITTFTVPGSWEIPLVAKKVAETKKYDAIITFGVIVKGETYHFEMIANEAARALMQISVKHGLPIALEILAVFNKQQAIERASDNENNKGIEAAIAVLKMLVEIKKI
jgi:6,7-dimethyl-8-ribityllumazine synthase